MLALTEIKLKENEEVSWWRVNSIITGVRERAIDREGVAGITSALGVPGHNDIEKKSGGVLC